MGSLLHFWVSRLPLTQALMDSAVSEHAAVVDAIESGDSAGARVAMGVAADRMAEQIRLALPAEE